jgi:hypothetical protein
MAEGEAAAMLGPGRLPPRGPRTPQPRLRQADVAVGWPCADAHLRLEQQQNSLTHPTHPRQERDAMLAVPAPELPVRHDRGRDPSRL